MDQEQATAAYAEFLADLPRFEAALERVLAEWVRSCEHYLSNERMNRIAWLGQAAMCIATGVPAGFRGGYHHLTLDQQAAADEMALKYLNRWLADHAEATFATVDEAASQTVMDLY